MSDLGRWFKYEEFEVTSTGLPNELTEDARQNVKKLVYWVLDPLRWELQEPIIITSGYRSAVVNEAVGGAVNSHHLTGKAADFKLASGSPVYRAEQILSLLEKLPVDECIFYHPSQGGHIHVSVDTALSRMPLKPLFKTASGSLVPWTPNLLVL